MTPEDATHQQANIPYALGAVSVVTASDDDQTGHVYNNGEDINGEIKNAIQETINNKTKTSSGNIININVEVLKLYPSELSFDVNFECKYTVIDQASNKVILEKTIQSEGHSEAFAGMERKARATERAIGRNIHLFVNALAASQKTQSN